MRNLATAFQQALTQSRDTGIQPRQFVYFTVKDRTSGAPVSLGLWTGDEDVNVSVIDPETGNPEGRTYYGARNLTVGSIARTSDLTTQTVEITFSQISDVSANLFRAYDMRLGKVEIHEMVMNGGTLVSDPEIVFLGEIDEAPLTTPSVGNDGNISIKAVSDAISMLSIQNPLKSSYQGQLVRNTNDEWGIYGSTISTWDIPWAKKSSSSGNNNGSLTAAIAKMRREKRV